MRKAVDGQRVYRKRPLRFALARIDVMKRRTINERDRPLAFQERVDGSAVLNIDVTMRRRDKRASGVYRDERAAKLAARADDSDRTRHVSKCC